MQLRRGSILWAAFWIVWVVFFAVFLTNCCSRPAEYKINGEWKKCYIGEQKACGLTLVCEDNEVYECSTNVESKGECK